MDNNEIDALMYLRIGERLAEFNIKYQKITKLDPDAIRELHKRGAVDTPYAHNTVLTIKGRRYADMWLSPCVDFNVDRAKERDARYSTYQNWLDKKNDPQLEPDYQEFGVYIHNRGVIGYITTEEITITCTGVKRSPKDIIVYQQRELNVWDKAQIVQKELQCLGL